MYNKKYVLIQFKKIKTITNIANFNFEFMEIEINKKIYFSKLIFFNK